MKKKKKEKFKSQIPKKKRKKSPPPMVIGRIENCFYSAGDRTEQTKGIYSNLHFFLVFCIYDVIDGHNESCYDSFGSTRQAASNDI